MGTPHGWRRQPVGLNLLSINTSRAFRTSRFADESQSHQNWKHLQSLQIPANDSKTVQRQSRLDRMGGTFLPAA